MQANRETYHHGDLRHALIEVGLELCRGGGPDKVTMREATRAVGVTVNAAYRHFDDLAGYLEALAQECQSRLAERIEQAAGGARGEELLKAVGVTYIAFALDEPGWFATAFHVPQNLSKSASPQAAGPGGRTPFVLLNDALDDMVADGQLAPARRLGADVFCWSAVHGFAQLALAGPLRELDRPTQDQLSHLVVLNSIAGLVANPAD